MDGSEDGDIELTGEVGEVGEKPGEGGGAALSGGREEGVEWIEGGRFAELKLIGDVHRQVATMSPSSAPPIGRKLFDQTHTHVAIFAAPDNPIHITYDQSSIYELVHAQPRMSVLRLRGLEVSQTE